MRLYVKDEELHYYDFTSLYPYVNKYKAYPKGHPLIYTGLMKCGILAPQDLFHPVIPVRIPVSKNGHKLMFTLCAQCAKEQNLDECEHTDEQRTLRGTWATPI